MKPGKALRAAVLLMTAMMFVCVCASCGESGSDDDAMTKALLDSYMHSLCDYNIAGMNQCCMAGLEPYGDGSDAVKSCRAIAGSIRWECESVVINGSSATARIRLTVPKELGKVCQSALDDAVKSFDKEPEGNPSELLASAIKKRVGMADAVEMSAEIFMAKVDNKWFIVRSADVNRVVTEIRTPVAAVFAVLGQ